MVWVSQSGSDVLTDEGNFSLEPLAAVLTFEKNPSAMQMACNPTSVVVECFSAWLELVAFPATDFSDALCGFGVHGLLFGLVVRVSGVRMFSEMRVCPHFVANSLSTLSHHVYCETNGQNRKTKIER